MIQDTIRQFYPKALGWNEFINRFYRIVASDYELKPSQVMVAQSICSDDVNNIQYPTEGRQMLGPFNLGGLNGYPFTGQTGMGAFAHHIPNDGAALIFYGPHIGVGEGGKPGQILRIGHQQPSACCGAMVKALQSLDQGTIAQEPKNPTDYQQETLESLVYESADRIKAAESPLMEATRVIYEASSSRVDQYIRGTDFLGNYIFVVGAILINSDREHGAFLELQRLECLDAKTKEVIKSYPLEEINS